MPLYQHLSLIAIQVSCNLLTYFGVLKARPGTERFLWSVPVIVLHFLLPACMQSFYGGHLPTSIVFLQTSYLGTFKVCAPGAGLHCTTALTSTSCDFPGRAGARTLLESRASQQQVAEFLAVSTTILNTTLPQAGYDSVPASPAHVAPWGTWAARGVPLGIPAACMPVHKMDGCTVQGQVQLAGKCAPWGSCCPTWPPLH
jgi:hypothetical protein